MKMNHKIVSIFIVTLLPISRGFAQEQKGIRDKANHFYNQYEYAIAVPMYQKLVAKKPLLPDMEKLANSYLKMNDYQSAEKWYVKIVESPKCTNSNILTFAEVLKYNEKYPEAKQMFTRYASASGIEQQNAISGCDSAILWKNVPSLHKIKNEENINNSLSQFSPFTNKGTFYYTSEIPKTKNNIYGWTGNGFLRVFNSANLPEVGLIESASLSNIPLVNGEYHAGSMVSNYEGDLFIATKTSTNKHPDVVKSGKSKYVTRVLELYFYSKDNNGKWVEKSFKHNNPKYSVGHAALSKDGKILYFASNFPGGFGGTDIWFSELQEDENWGKPQNCGNLINTNGNEEFPTISDENVLYFSSTGLLGMGGLDIFKSRGNRNNWDAPQNLKYPLNSSADDFGLIEIKNNLGSTGYFSSNRKDGKGSDDIYSFTYVEPIKFELALQAKVIDKNNNALLSDVNFIFLKNGDELFIDKSINNGTFFFKLEKNANYTLIAEKSGFLKDSIQLSTFGLNISDTMINSIYLEPLFVKGETIRLENILYESGKYNINEQAALVLNKIEKMLSENSSLKIELSSHTDSRGKDMDNLLLSQNRAQAAVNYLINRGIDKNRMVPKGYGETKVINRCKNNVKCSNEEYQVNRRTEITILSF